MKKPLFNFSLIIPQFRYDQVVAAPYRKSDEGEVPFDRMVIQGSKNINGIDAPHFGPVDIVIETNIIKQVSY